MSTVLASNHATGDQRSEPPSAMGTLKKKPEMACLNPLFCALWRISILHTRSMQSEKLRNVFVCDPNPWRHSQNGQQPKSNVADFMPFLHTCSMQSEKLRSVLFCDPAPNMAATAKMADSQNLKCGGFRCRFLHTCSMQSEKLRSVFCFAILTPIWPPQPKWLTAKINFWSSDENDRRLRDVIWCNDSF